MTTPTMTVPSGHAVQSRPVPWRNLAWVTLRQHRGLFIGLGVLLGLIAVYLVVMAIIQDNAYAAVAACHPAGVLRCRELKSAFISDYWGGDNSVLQSGGAQTVSSLMFAVPVLLGAFAGAPLLSRELESGTFRFAWTQGAGRTRWVLSTLVVPALVMIAATGAFTAIFYWYLRPFFALGQVSEMLPLSFALLGVAFAAWTLLAYALAAFLGAVFRRTVLAMVITLVLYVVLAMATATAIRPHYATPVTVPSVDVGSTSASNSSGWVISDLEKAPNGQALSRDDLYHYFQGLPSSVQNSANSNAFTTWLTKHGYTAWTSLQPDSRFWEFQLIEGAWLVGLSATLIGATVWLVRRRGA
jgi:ABC-type transport system involved in multi-copper enzyme maturation permease subunit